MLSDNPLYLAQLQQKCELRESHSQKPNSLSCRPQVAPIRRETDSTRVSTLDNLDKDLLGGYLNRIVTTRQTAVGNAVNDYLDSIDGAFVGTKCTF